MVHSVVNVLAKDCSFPKGFSLSYLIYGMIITGFFANFYMQAYLKKRNEAYKKNNLSDKNNNVIKNSSSNGNGLHSHVNGNSIKKQE
jgi:hypothetical protein